MSAGGRTSRDTLLLAAAAILTGSALLLVISSILSLIDELQNGFLAGLKVGSGFDLLAELLALATFATAIGAFAAVDRLRRARLLVIALALYAAGALASLVSDLLSAIEYGTHHASGTFTADYAVSTASDLALAAAALIALLAFKSAAGERDGRLGWAAIVLAVSLALKLTSGVLLMTYLSHDYYPSGMTSGLGVGVAGTAVKIGGAVVAAVAFLFAVSRRRAGGRWFAEREGLLAIAAAVLAVAFLISGIGAMVLASAESGAGFEGKLVASDWLRAIGELVVLGAAGSAAAGFFVSRRGARGPVAAPAVADGPPPPAPPPAQPEKAFCPQCGTARTPGDRFCSSCGAAF